MIKRLLILVLLLPFFVNGQSNTVASGAIASGTTGTATYSIGQITYKANIDATGIVSQGNQQIFEIATLSTTEIPEIQLFASVYPNPTIEKITLSIRDYDFSTLQFTLIDTQGRIISTAKITENETQINMDFLPSALYFIRITDATKELKTFKIIKNK